VTPVEFRGDIWRQKTRVPVLSCGVICVILRLAVLVELRLVTDIDRQTQAHNYRGCIASRGKNFTFLLYKRQSGMHEKELKFVDNFSLPASVFRDVQTASATCQSLAAEVEFY